MKKLLALALALTMALTLAACGGKSDSDVKYVKDKGTLVVGMTDFAPMDYRDGNGEWIGFDADMAKAFAESLGVKAEFIEITWDSKAMELETKAIDVVWNGMTLTDEVKSLMGVSEPYCKNAQVVVLSADHGEMLGSHGRMSKNIWYEESIHIPLLMRQKGRPISTEQFMESIWGYDSEAEINVVWAYVSYLRRKLEAAGANLRISARRGQGYVLEEVS